MGRTFAVSDIHGYKQCLKQLLDVARYDALLDQLYLLGDYINKGPDSVGTLELVRQLCQQGATALQGNNERKLLKHALHSAEGQPLLLPKHMLAFVSSLPLWAEDEQYIYVHAGLRHGIPLQEQSAADLTEIRESFYTRPTGVSKKVVFGHTSTHLLGVQKGEICRMPDKIGIDTGAGHHIALSLIDLTNQLVYRCDVHQPHAVQISRWPPTVKMY